MDDMNFQFQFTVSRFAFQIQTSRSRKFFSQNVLSRQRVSLDKFPKADRPTYPALSSPIQPYPPYPFFQLRCIHCSLLLSPTPLYLPRLISSFVLTFTCVFLLHVALFTHFNDTRRGLHAQQVLDPSIKGC